MTALPMQSIKAAINEVGFAGQSFISINSMTNEQLISLFELGKKLELMNRDRWDLYPGAITTLLFFQPSTRTRMSFETAMNRLGGNVIVENSPATTSSIAKEESLSDMLRCVAQYSNIMVLRHPDSDAARDAVNYVGDTPLINGGWGHWEHPTQALLDLYTIVEGLGEVGGLKVAMVGDLKFGRTVHSLTKLLVNYDVEFNFVSPDILRMPDDVLEVVRNSGHKFTVTEDVHDVIADADVLYITRVQKERFSDLTAYERMKDFYVVDEKLMAKAKQRMIVMHPLPRINEIAYTVDSDPRAAYFRQMRNGMYIRMALLAAVLGKA